MVTQSGPRGHKQARQAAAPFDIPAPPPAHVLLIYHDDGTCELYAGPDVRLIEREWPADMPERVFARSVPVPWQSLLWPRYSRLIVPVVRTPEGRERQAVLRMLSELDPLTLAELDALALATGRTLAETLTHYYRVRTGGAR